MSDAGWVIVLPVKPLAQAKSRLTELTITGREELALAMARDTVAAALGSAAVRGVVVVTDDARVCSALTADHRDAVLVAADEPKAGLNPALLHGIAVATRWRPDLGIAVLTADLPALRSSELDAVLANVTATEVIVVGDADGTGTTLLASFEPALLTPHFGVDSFARHRAGGARSIDTPAVPGLRRDVDHLADLATVGKLGVGPNTAAFIDLPADVRRGPASTWTPALDQD